MNRTAVTKAVALGVVLAGLGAAALILGPPDIGAVRTQVDDAGAWAPALFFAVYVGLSLIPCPMALLTAAGGALFGLVPGATLALSAALVGAVVSFAVGRLLGREAVDRLTRGRLGQVDDLLRNHGLAAVLVVRLVPLFPFIVVNYAAGLSGVRLRHYVVGSAVGMVPGSLAYAALGAYGSDPLGLAAAVSALVLLVLGGAWWGRRLGLRGPGAGGPLDCPVGESAGESAGEARA